MAMRCPNCSNEISLEETFCGQCGTPFILSAKPVDPANRQGLLSSGYYSVTSPPSNNQPPMLSSGSQQQNGFYQDPTQAMPVLPSNQVQSYPTMYPQQDYGSSSIPVGYSGTGQYTPQMQPLHLQSGNYTGTMYPPTQTFPSGQGYGMPPGFTPPPPQKRSNLALIIISICITLALVTILLSAQPTLYAITLPIKHNSPIKMLQQQVFQHPQRCQVPAQRLLHLPLLHHRQHLHQHLLPTQVSPCATLHVPQMASQ